MYKIWQDDYILFAGIVGFIYVMYSLSMNPVGDVPS